jgi:hypothetical protein
MRGRAVEGAGCHLEAATTGRGPRFSSFGAVNFSAEELSAGRPETLQRSRDVTAPIGYDVGIEPADRHIGLSTSPDYLEGRARMRSMR